MQSVKSYSKVLAFLAVFYLFFRYLGEFSSQQSGILAMAGWLGYELYEDLNASRRAEKAFSPFCVSIHPNWYPLLSDFKLVGSIQEWHKLREAADELPTSEYNVFRSGIFFTVIKPPSENGVLPGLTYCNDLAIFLSDLKISESIVEVKDESILPKPGENHPLFKHPRWAGLPEIYFEWRIDGYELGLKVELGWWENLCKSGEIGELARTKTHKDHLCGTAQLEIATLPYSEFGLYYHEAKHGAMNKELEAMYKQLEVHGWKRKDQRDAEIRDPWSRVEHRYFTLSHREI